MTERELIARVESADAVEFVEILRHLTDKEAAALRAYWGRQTFDQMRELALTRRTRAATQSAGNVVVLHGIMGSELDEFKADSSAKSVWLSILRLIGGAFTSLSLNSDGSSKNDIRPTGVLKKYYGLQLLTLAQRWNVRAFWYDWRADINSSAALLARKLSDWFPGKPVHLVAHSMGGLVARAFIAHHAPQWNAMWDTKKKEGARLVMLGTPNRGSFAIPQLLMGMNDVLRIVSMADLFNSKRDLVETIKTFVGPYQMLPSPDAIKDASILQLYQSKTYGSINPPQDRFDKAREFHKALAPVVDPARMMYVAGYNHPTYDGIRALDKLDSADGYTATMRGDGTVPHNLGLLEGIPTFYVEEEHGALPNNKTVIAATEDLLARGDTGKLSRQLPAGVRAKEDPAKIVAEIRRARQKQEDDFTALVAQHRMSLRARGSAAAVPDRLHRDEGALEDMVVNAFLRSPAPPETAKPEDRTAAAPVKPPKTELRVRVLNAGIQDAGSAGSESVDAICVGHYVGVIPVSAEAKLDEAISEGSPEKVLRRFTERGVIRGDLGQLFLMDDPRKPRRAIVVAGMGSYGRFGTPECTALARELYGSLALLGKKDIATVLIGSGQGNLSVREALTAWIEGIRQAQIALAQQNKSAFPRITFIEYDCGRTLSIYRVVESLRERWKESFALHLETKFTASQITQLEDRWATAERDRLKRSLEGGADAKDSETPTRLTIERAGAMFRFSAITESASVPLREIHVDPELVDEANNQLVAQFDSEDPNAILAAQEDAGSYLQKLLIPEELEKHLTTNHPLIITCDATCARIHWEMIAQPRLLNASGTRSFLGVDRSLTRQLATTFASLPEKEAPAEQPFRALIIGDPAADDPLPGAQDEAEQVRELLSQFKGPRRIDVTALIGPQDATRTRVMHELIMGEFDIVHYAGHCMFDTGNPTDSGWIFTGGKKLRAHELGRVRRMPRFVFSNACESGITPERASERNAALGPSFAEAFFARGVRNFICTGWPVGDVAALEFAKEFYGRLLGGAPIHNAMREARLVIQTREDGVYTWGAYQHYGDPYWRLFGHPRR
jgi:pimeloyl-ACP methyl ester carboxylesterase